MIVQCPSCETKFRIADARVSKTGVKVRCSKCAQVFVVRNDPSSASLESIAAAPAPAVPPPLPPPEGAAVAPRPEPEGTTEELFTGFDPGRTQDDPSPDPAVRLSGAKDPFAPTPEPAPDPSDPESDGSWDRIGLALDADPFASTPGADPEPDPDPFFEAAPRFGDPQGRGAPAWEGPPPLPPSDLGPPPLPGEDPSVRFPPPPALTREPTPGPEAGFESNDPFAPDPFAEPAPFDPEPDPSHASPFEDPPAGAADPSPAGTPALGTPVAIGRIAPVRVRPPPDEAFEPEPEPARVLAPVPELKWPPRLGLLLGLAFALLWLRPGTLDWAGLAMTGAAGGPVRTVQLEARPYPLRLEDPPWIVSGWAETRGSAFPDGLQARIRVRAGPTLIADVEVPVGVLPPAPVVAGGPEVLQRFWLEHPPPPLSAASRTAFMAVLRGLPASSERLTIDVEYVAGTPNRARVDPVPTAPR